MQFVHTDLDGPITPVAKDGFKYTIDFVDDFSDAVFVYFLKEKSDAIPERLLVKLSQTPTKEQMK